MRDEHRDDHGSRDYGPISTDSLQIQWDVEKVRPIDDALKSTVRQDQVR